MAFVIWAVLLMERMRRRSSRVLAIDHVPVERIKDFQGRLTEYLTTSKPDLLAHIVARKALDDALVSELKDAAEQFKPLWS